MNLTDPNEQGEALNLVHAEAREAMYMRLSEVAGAVAMLESVPTEETEYDQAA